MPISTISLPVILAPTSAFITMLRELVVLQVRIAVLMVLALIVCALALLLQAIVLRLANVLLAFIVNLALALQKSQQEVLALVQIMINVRPAIVQ